MRKTIILLFFVCITVSLRGQTQYRLWIDGQTEQTVAGTATPTAHVDLDVSALSNGLHQLFIALCDDKGLPVEQQSRIFLKTSTDETLLYRYWFDDDTEGEQTGTITNSAYLNLDVSALSNGIHMLNFVLSDLSQTILGQQSSLFVKVSTGGIVRYEYFVNNLDTPVGGETLSSPTIPYHLMADLDVSGVTPAPLRSDNFYFFIDEGQPVVMAKNDIYFRFYDEDYNYIEDAAQYADLSTSEDVVAEQLESKVTKRADIPAPEKISWFKADAEAGDSVLFKVNVPATMKLFAPDGTELMLTEEKEISLRIVDEGTYYLAVYDAKAGSTSKIDVYFERVAATGALATDRQQYLPGETVTITGTVAGASNADIEVYVMNEGVKQTISAKTDAQGAFTAEWTPFRGQMGTFTISIGYKGYELNAKPVTVDIIGLRRSSNAYITCDATVDEPFVGEIEVVNPCGVTQHIKEVKVLQQPENCETKVDNPYTIAAKSKASVKYTLTGSAPSSGQEWELVRLLVTTEEGAELEVTLYYYCHSQKAVLAFGESLINTTMVKGTSRDYPVVIINHGKGETGKIQLSMPNLPWMSLITPAELNSLSYGEQATIMLRLTPGNDLPLNVPQTGSIGVNCENGNGISIPFSVEVVSEQTGTLTIDVVDEFSGDDAAGPHVNGAIVEVKHPTTGEVVAKGTTGTDGKCSIELPEGYYGISVTAEKHNSYTNYVLVDPGRELIQEVFLSYEAITYSWTMEETEVEDMYEIVTSVTFETNVPKPVLVITLPKEKPGPNEIFSIELKNEGLINVEHVDMSAYCTSGFDFEIIDNETLDVLGPKETHTYHGVIKADAELWSSSCFSAYVVADGYYRCRGLQHVQARADLYRCTQTQQGNNAGEKGTWPGAISPVINTGKATVTGDSNSGTAPWINWPCETCLARVKLEFNQTMTMNRPAYRGILTLYNGHESVDMTNVGLNIVITDEEGSVATSEKFESVVESLNVFTGDDTLTGDWTLGAGQTGTAKVLFIPSPLAAPDGPRTYTFSGTLTCTDPFSGQHLSLPLNASTFTVLPLPELELAYLMQRDIYGDDPLTTDVTESSKPAEFVLIINNVGNGEAKNVRIVTEQPVVSENDKGLLIDFSIDSSYVNGKPANLLLDRSIVNNFGDIPAHAQTYAQWWLSSSLLGHFVSYDVKVAHQTSYGNSNLSLLSDVTIYEMIHGFTPQASTSQRAWLVNKDEQLNGELPDAVYFSDATQQPLHIATCSVTDFDEKTACKLVITPKQAGWNYGIVPDPTNGKMELTRVERVNDGMVMPLDNVWQTDRTLLDSKVWLYENRLHFVGNLTSDSEEYLLTFGSSVGVEDVLAGNGSLKAHIIGEKLYVTGNFYKIHNVTIYDMQGIKAFEASDIPSGRNIFVGNLHAGIYFIQVVTDGGVCQTKMLKR